jgi:hypothetical protein
MKLKFHKRKCSTASHKILSSDSYPSTSQCGLLTKTGVLTFSVRFLWLNTIHDMRGVFSYVQCSPAPSCLHCRRVGFVPIFNGHLLFSFPSSEKVFFQFSKINTTPPFLSLTVVTLIGRMWNLRTLVCPLTTTTSGSKAVHSRVRLNPLGKEK